MGVSLTSDSGNVYHMSHGTWCYLLKLCFDHGWKPAGTEAPLYECDEADWNGSYTENHGQSVSAEDAAAMADALYLAVLDPAPYIDEDCIDLFSSDPIAPEPRNIAFLRKMISFFSEGFFWID